MSLGTSIMIQGMNRYTNESSLSWFINVRLVFGRDYTTVLSIVVFRLESIQIKISSNN